MVIKRQITFILCFALLLIASCAMPIKSKISPVKPGMIPDYSFNQSVRVVNVQNTQTVRLGHTAWELNLKETTDVAVELIKNELSKRGFQIQYNAKKILEISISDVRFSLVWVGLRNIDKCIVVLRARTGNGFFKKYQEYNVAESVSICDFAITKTVSKLLSDENIINYLKND